jgi:translation elongation factor EF-1alpha
MSVTDISKGSRTNVVNVAGRLESGVLQVGDAITVEPGGNRGTVRCKCLTFQC